MWRLCFEEIGGCGMTEQEAIEVLKDFDKQVSDKADGACQSTIGRIACSIASKALEKQIPKKPEYEDTRFRNHGKHISDGGSLEKCYKCPNCNTHIFHVFDSEIFCHACGQALDWE